MLIYLKLYILSLWLNDGHEFDEISSIFIVFLIIFPFFYNWVY